MVNPKSLKNLTMKNKNLTHLTLKFSQVTISLKTRGEREKWE